jgi:hypothetical protein
MPNMKTPIWETVARLDSAVSSQEGENILTELRNKPYFQAILTYLGVPFRASDTIAQLQRKIIENTIDYRIRSASIRNYGKDGER